jgi:predicted ATPase
MFSTRLEDFPEALALASRCEAIAKTMTDSVAGATADCIKGAAFQGLGDYAQALAYVRRAQRRDMSTLRRAQIVRSGRDHVIQARCIMAQSLWLQGLLDQAAETIRDTVADAQAGGHPNSHCFALVWCVGVVFTLLGRGDIEIVRPLIADLKDNAEKHAFSSYVACALGFEGMLSFRRGDLASAERLLRASLDGLRQTRYDLLYTPFLSILAEVQAAAGQLDSALAAAEEALGRTERHSALWWTPEALRIKGDILILSDQENMVVAKDHFEKSLDLARRQGALSWELRAAKSYGRLLHAHGRTQEAYDLLNSVYIRFTEGFGTADLQSAKRQLDAWDKR